MRGTGICMCTARGDGFVAGSWGKSVTCVSPDLTIGVCVTTAARLQQTCSSNSLALPNHAYPKFAQNLSVIPNAILYRILRFCQALIQPGDTLPHTTRSYSPAYNRSYSPAYNQELLSRIQPGVTLLHVDSPPRSSCDRQVSTRGAHCFESARASHWTRPGCLGTPEASIGPEGHSPSCALWMGRRVVRACENQRMVTEFSEFQ